MGALEQIIYFSQENYLFAKQREKQEQQFFLSSNFQKKYSLVWNVGQTPYLRKGKLFFCENGTQLREKLYFTSPTWLIKKRPLNKWIPRITKRMSMHCISHKPVKFNAHTPLLGQEEGYLRHQSTLLLWNCTKSQLRHLWSWIITNPQFTPLLNPWSMSQPIKESCQRSPQSLKWLGKRNNKEEAILGTTCSWIYEV